MARFHDAIVYVDESGDHGPVSDEYPVFVLAFCLFDKMSYAEDVTTAVQKLKFRHFGHDAVILHERDIRKRTPPFKILRRQDVRDAFMEDLGALVDDADFTLIASAIRKDQMTAPANIYHLAMEFGLERIALHYALAEDSPRMHLVCESRGKREDDELELAVRRICDGQNYRRAKLPFDVVFSGKSSAMAGMGLADLVARPIGRHLLKPDQPNRAWDGLQAKFRRGPEGRLEGWGLKVFP